MRVFLSTLHHTSHFAPAFRSDRAPGFGRRFFGSVLPLGEIATTRSEALRWSLPTVRSSATRQFCSLTIRMVTFAQSPQKRVISPGPMSRA
jgi:hypothetical protein